MDSRTVRDFIMLYNRMTERCFHKCTETTNSRQLTPTEIDCVDHCAAKFVSYNHRLMLDFIKYQNEVVTRRMKEAEELEKANNSNSPSAVEHQQNVLLPSS